jgi:hypothetical protein
MSSKKMPKSLSLIGLPRAVESPVMLAATGACAAPATWSPAPGNAPARAAALVARPTASQRMRLRGRLRRTSI